MINLKESIVRIVVLLAITCASLASHSQNSESTMYLQFGVPVESVTPEIFIEFNVYYQDITQGLNRLGNLTRVQSPIDTIRLFPPGATGSYPDFEFEWHLNDTLVTTEQNPRISDLQLSFSGVQWLHCYCKHLPTGVTFNRGKWVYLQYNDFNDLPDYGIIPEEYLYVPEGETQPSSFGVFVESFPDWFHPYEFTEMEHDYDHDGSVTVIDLVQFLVVFNY